MKTQSNMFAAVVVLFFALTVCFPAGAALGAGTVSGTIKVYRTKVKTDGPKSYKEVVVYLENEAAKKIPPPQKHAVMDQRSMTFIPHVAAIQKGTTVDFLNNDNELHNVYCPEEDVCGKDMDLGTWGQGKIRSFTFKIPGVGILLCKKHLEMAAYVAVLETPYFSVAEIDKASQSVSFTIDGIPPGNYVLKIWHKKLLLKGGELQVTVQEGKTTTADIQITKKKYAKSKK